MTQPPTARRFVPIALFLLVPLFVAPAVAWDVGTIDPGSPHCTLEPVACGEVKVTDCWGGAAFFAAAAPDPLDWYLVVEKVENGRVVWADEAAQRDALHVRRTFWVPMTLVDGVASVRADLYAKAPEGAWRWLTWDGQGCVSG